MGINCLLTANVKGCKRVPEPPANIIPFMLLMRRFDNGSMCQFLDYFMFFDEEIILLDILKISKISSNNSSEFG